MLGKEKIMCNKKEKRLGINVGVGVGILFVLTAIIALFVPCFFLTFSELPNDTAIVFATLSGAILVFATIRLQQQALEEEKQKNQRDRADAQFMPLLSSLRIDAGQIGFIFDTIGPQGKEIRYNSTGEIAFKHALQAFEHMFEHIRNYNFQGYDKEVFMAEYKNACNYPDETHYDSWIVDNVDKEVEKCIKGWEVPYLIYKHNITKDNYEEYKKKDDICLRDFILKKMKEYQPTTFNVYLQKVAFLLKFIGKQSHDTAEDYYEQFSSYLGKEEYAFLKRIGLLRAV